MIPGFLYQSPLPQNVRNDPISTCILQITNRLLARISSIQAHPFEEQVSEPLAGDSFSHSDTVAETLTRTITTSQAQIKAEISNIQSGSNQGPQPPVAFKETDSASRRGRLQTQNSYDSLRTVVRHDDSAPSPTTSEAGERDSVLFKDLPGITEEDWVSDDGVRKATNSKANTSNKAPESLFGRPSKEQTTSTRFVSKQDPLTNTHSGFQLPQQERDSPLSYPEPSAELLQKNENTDSNTTSSHFTKSNLPTITEGESKNGTKKTLDQLAPTTERGFISAEDLLARLAVQPVRELTSIPDQSIVNPKVRLSSDKKMDLLKRERRRPTPPSLRRAGSQLESPNASSENIIFGGERYQTPENKGKGKEAIKRTDIYVRRVSIEFSKCYQTNIL